MCQCFGITLSTAIASFMFQVLVRGNLNPARNCRVQWLRGRALDYLLREPGFESCAAMLKPCSSSISCIHEYMAIDSGGYVYE